MTSGFVATQRSGGAAGVWCGRQAARLSGPGSQSMGRRVGKHPLPHHVDDVAAATWDHFDASVRDLVLPPSRVRERRVFVELAVDEKCLRRDPGGVEIRSFERGRYTTEHEPVDAVWVRRSKNCRSQPGASPADGRERILRRLVDNGDIALARQRRARIEGGAIWVVVAEHDGSHTSDRRSVLKGRWSRHPRRWD